MKYRIALDVGGTFTDAVAVDVTGKLTFVKTESTPEDQSIGVMNGLERLAGEIGIERSKLLSKTERIVHGMTVATNALIGAERGKSRLADHGRTSGRPRKAGRTEARALQPTAAALGAAGAENVTSGCSGAHPS
jgi:hypothetical protein